MKKLMLVSTVLIGALFLAAPLSPQAQTDTQVYKVPFPVDMFVPCANDGLGEQILGTGTVKASITTTVNKNNIHLIFTYNPQGITAVGQSTGTTYHVTGVTRQDVNMSVAEFPWIATFVNRARLVSEGSGGDMFFYLTSHLTINANGTTTVIFDDINITCR